MDGERKSIEPMAERLPDGDVQALQQFVNQSPWSTKGVQASLARKVEREFVPEAYWSAIHRWLADGFIAGEQITPGAPWRIRINNEMRARFAQEVPEGHVSMLEATKLLGVSRQTVLQRVKRGELTAVHVSSGKRNGLYIKVFGIQATLFDNLS